MEPAKTKVIRLGMITGNAPDIIPYISHKKIPKTKTEYINNEISFVDLVFNTNATCGINESVVHPPPIKPIRSI